MSSRQFLIADPDEGQRQLLDLLLADANSVLVAVGTVCYGIFMIINGIAYDQDKD